MPTFSRVHTVKSNARRQARKEGIDPNLVVACAGGFHYPLPEPEPVEPVRWFKSFASADTNAKAQAKRSGLKASAFRIVVSYNGAKPEYGYIPANATTKYDVVTGEVAPTPKAEKPEPVKLTTKPAVVREKPAAKRGDGQSKMTTVLALITRPSGATMPEIVEATGWLPHTARARISGLVEEHKLSINRQRLLGVTTYKAAHRMRQASAPPSTP